VVAGGGLSSTASAPTCRRPRLIIRRGGLEGRPCSADRAQSLARVSRKREYSALLPETFGNFSLQFQELGLRRLTPKSRKPAISGLFSHYRPDILGAPHCLAGAGGFEPRYGDLDSDALACPRGVAEPLFVDIHRPFETLEFREPYRIRGVQSFRDKWAFRRITCGPLQRRSAELE
jgi:hypothetical protein